MFEINKNADLKFSAQDWNQVRSRSKDWKT